MILRFIELLSVRAAVPTPCKKMIKNFFVMTFRQISRNRLFSSINIFGLSIGLVVALVITFFVSNDLMFDRFHKNYDNIYRVVTFNTSRDRLSAVTSGPLIEMIREKIPEVEAATRMAGNWRVQLWTGEPESDPSSDPNIPQFSGMCLGVDPGFLKIFSFKLIQGDSTAFSAPGGVVLTENAAKALFGDDDPLGKPLNSSFLENAFVSGVIEAPPEQSHIQFDFLFTFDIQISPDWFDAMNALALNGYFLLDKSADPEKVLEDIRVNATEHGLEDMWLPVIQPMKDLHLYSSHVGFEGVNRNKGDITRVRVLIASGVLILLIASINFINLSSARSIKRAKEIGMRKVVGARKSHLITQFIGESVVMSLIAMIIALVIFQFSFSPMSTMLGNSMEYRLWQHPFITLGLLGVAVLIGFLSGLYPAIILSSFKISVVLKGLFRNGSKGFALRRILVVGQFALTIALIFSALTVMKQIQFMLNKDVGFNREQVVILPLPPNDEVRDAVNNHPNVVSTGIMDVLPGHSMPSRALGAEGCSDEEFFSFDRVTVNEGFIPTFEASIALGRNFSPEFGTDTSEAVIINETAARLLGYDEPIGKKLFHARGEDIGGEETPYWTIVGVIEDIHFGMASKIIDPMVLVYRIDFGGRFLVRISEHNLEKTIEEIQNIYAPSLQNSNDFEYLFLDEYFGRQFENEKTFAKEVGMFSILAIFIACLGLFGLSIFTTEQRTKEIAVRKVLGASEGKIIQLLIMDFLRWIILANIIAWPLGYYVMRLWLRAYVYKTSISIDLFIGSALAAVAIALVTIIFQTAQASRLNPTKALKQNS